MAADETCAPPRLATLLIQRRLPCELAEALAGDLEEEYRTRVLPVRGSVRADLWYWGQALALHSGRLRRLSRRLGAMRPTWERNRPRRVGRDQPDFWSKMFMYSEELKYAVRRLAKTPGFTLVAVLSLGLGIGVNTTVFSAIDSVFSRPLPIEGIDEFVRFESPSFSYPEYRDLRANLTSLSSLVAGRKAGAVLRTAEGTETLLGSSVSRNYFTALGIKSAVGRLFTEDDGTDAAGDVVVLSHELWMRRFGGDPSVVGRTITLNERPFTVLGVAAKGFYGERRMPRSEWWTPLDVSAADLSAQGTRFDVMGRLKPGITAVQVQAEADALAMHLEWTLPTTAAGDRLIVRTEAQSTGDHGGRLIYLVMPMVCLVLLVACANVSGLLLARHEERRRDLAMRLALGAGRSHLMRQLLAEGLLLALLGTGVGLLFTVWSRHLVTSLVPTSLAALTPDLRLDGRVLGLSIGLSALAAAASSLAPAWRATGLDPAPTLKGQTPARSAGLRPWAGRNVLVVGQLAVSMVFLVVAMLFVRGFLLGAGRNPGFSERNLLVVTVSPEMSGLDRDQARDYYLRLEKLVSTLPGVRAVSFAARAPLGLSGGGMAIPVSLPEAETSEPSGAPTRYNVIQPRYFGTVGINLLAGRDFRDGDDATAQRVAIVSEALARQHWPGQDPLGRSIRVGGNETQEFEVVGVVRDVAVIRMDEVPEPYLYLPSRQMPGRPMALLVASRGDLAALAPAVRRTMQEVDPRVPALTVETMPGLIRFALMPQWMGAWFGAALGGLTVLLAVGGLFALVAYAVSRRTHEIGIRMALGARPQGTLWMVLRQGLFLGLAGVGFGLPVAVAIGHVMRSLLLGIGPADPVALGGASLAVIGVALLASLGPARRATKVDPITALRTE